MRDVIKRDQVRLEANAARKLGELTDPQAGACPPPGLRLVRVEGRVQAIELTCECGEVTLVELEYDPSLADTPADTPAEA